MEASVTEREEEFFDWLSFPCCAQASFIVTAFMFEGDVVRSPEGHVRWYHHEEDRAGFHCSDELSDEEDIFLHVLEHFHEEDTVGLGKSIGNIPWSMTMHEGAGRETHAGERNAIARWINAHACVLTGEKGSEAPCPTANVDKGCLL